MTSSILDISFLDILARSADAWWQFTVHASWQAALVGGLVLVAVWLGRRWPSPVRYWLLVLALVKFAMPPLWSSPTGVFSQAGPPVVLAASESPAALSRDVPLPGADAIQHASDASPDDATGGLPVEELAGSFPATPAASDAAPPEAAATLDHTAPAVSGDVEASVVPEPSVPTVSMSSPTWKSWLFLAYLLGMAITVAYSLVPYVRLRWALRWAAAITGGPLFERMSELSRRLGVRRTPRLLATDRSGSPFSLGLVRPTIVVPRELIEQLRGENLDAVLAHELAHHRRGDVWMNWLEAALLAAWWFHPVMWLVRRALRQACEDCCDDVVIGLRMASQDSYCETLLAVAAQQRGLPATLRLPAASIVPHMAAPRHPLARRLRRIMDGSLKRSRRLSWLGAVAILVLTCLLLPGLRTRNSEATAAPPADETAKTEKQPAKGADAEKKGTDAERTKALQVIVTADDRPVAGARVWLTRRDMFDPRSDEGAVPVGTATTDAAGGCQLAVPLKVVDDGSTREFRIYVSKPGPGLGIPLAMPTLPKKPLRVILPPEASTALTIADAQGKPVSNAVVAIDALSRDRAWAPFPDELKGLFTARTGVAGQVMFRGIARPDVYKVTVTSKTLGQQHFYFHDKTPLGERIVLREVGRVEGRLTCDDPKRTAGVPLRLFTMAFDRKPDDPSWYGVSELTTDAEGKFRVPAIATGKLTVVAFEPEDSPYRSTPLQTHGVRAGETTTVELSLRPAVLCRGTARDRESGKPVPGVGIVSAMAFGKVATRTEEAGNYRFYAVPGLSFNMVLPPAPYLSVVNLRTSIPDQRGEFELPPIELTRGSSLTGRVLDTEGKPVVGAGLALSWNDESFGGHHARAESDDDGQFEFPRVHPTKELSLTAYANGTRVLDPMNFTADTKQPLVVRLPKLEFITLSGRIVDEEGKPVGGIDYEVHATSPPQGNFSSHGKVFEGKTNDDGTFETPPRFRRGTTYQVRVVVRRAVIAESAWIVADRVGATKFPDLVFRRSRVPKEREPYRLLTLQGQAVDSQGRPVPGAKVIGWYNAERILTKTDGDGRFRLDGVPDYGGFVLIDAAGYRFFGQYVRPDGKPATFKLTGENEPAAGWTTLPNWLDSAKQIADQRKLVGVYGDKGYRGATQDYERIRALEVLAPADPARALELVEKGEVKLPWIKDHIRYRAGVAMMATQMDEAKAILNAIDSADLRGLAYREAAATLGRKDRERKLGLLAEALVQARAVREADHRAVAFSDVGAVLIEIGQTEQGTKLLREAEGLARELATRAWPAYARGHVAKRLGPLDPEGALRLAGAIEDASEFDRHHGILAIALAAKHPEPAERALKKIREARVRESTVPGICYYLASIDLDRAKRLAAEAGTVCARAHALGKTAEGLADTDPATAKKLLREAFDLLTKAIETESESSFSLVNPQNLAAGLLPVVEAVDPTLVPEFTWRVLSLRRNIAYGNESRVLGRHGEGQRMRMSDTVLAACLSRYNRDLARLLLQTPGDETLDGTDKHPEFYFASLTILDPEEAIRTAAKMPEDNADQKRAKGQAWQEIVATLSRTPRKRWEAIQERQLFVWYPGKE